MISSTNVELIPRRVLFGNPVKTSPQISPDGKKMAYLAPVNDVLNVWVGDVGKDNYQPVTNDEDRGIRFYFWASDNKHIIYLQDVGGNENWRLYASNLEIKQTRDLTPLGTWICEAGKPAQVLRSGRKISGSASQRSLRRVGTTREQEIPREHTKCCSLPVFSKMR